MSNCCFCNANSQIVCNTAKLPNATPTKNCLQRAFRRMHPPKTSSTGFYGFPSHKFYCRHNQRATSVLCFKPYQRNGSSCLLEWKTVASESTAPKRVFCSTNTQHHFKMCPMLCFVLNCLRGTLLNNSTAFSKTIAIGGTQRGFQRESTKKKRFAQRAT